MYKVMLIGDSITGFRGQETGYAAVVREMLSDKAHSSEVQIDTLPENGGDSRNLLALLADWPGEAHYAVIHFNCGLHDIKRLHGQAGIQVPIETYEANLHRLVELLQARATALVWARTTPVIDGQRVPSKDFDRFNADIEGYNRVADRVMAAHGVALNDLSAAVQADMAICLSADGVHMTAEGNRVLARQVVEAIRQPGD